MSRTAVQRNGFRPQATCNTNRFLASSSAFFLLCVMTLRCLSLSFALRRSAKASRSSKSRCLSSSVVCGTCPEARVRLTRMSRVQTTGLDTHSLPPFSRAESLQLSEAVLQPHPKLSGALLHVGVPACCSSSSASALSSLLILLSCCSSASASPGSSSLRSRFSRFLRSCAFRFAFRSACN